MAIRTLQLTAGLFTLVISIGVDPLAIHRQLREAIQDVLTTRHDAITNLSAVSNLRYL